MSGDLFMERRVRSLVRWNALAMVMRANDNDEGLGGHISSFASSATLYDVGFNYFFRGIEGGHPGDSGFDARAAESAATAPPPIASPPLAVPVASSPAAAA